MTISAMPHAARNTDPSRYAHIYTDTMLNPIPASDTSRYKASTISSSVMTSPPNVTPSLSGPFAGFSPYLLAALSFGYSCALTNSTNCSRCAPDLSFSEVNPSTGVPKWNSALNPVAVPLLGSKVLSVYPYRPSAAS